MRLRRIRLRWFRGVEEREVAFADGVTIVEGPNEIGKSSLHEALDLLFDFHDSSRHRAVLAVKPVDRDEGPEVEAEIETGPYRFVYRKRFVRRPETVLRIEAPRPEQLTGRPAHDRARAILKETIDEVLWGALRVQQGAPPAQDALAGAPSLARALDEAAGQDVSGERELTLFDSVRTEYLDYFTEQQRPRKSLVQLAERAATAAAAVERAEADLLAIERDVERSSELERVIADGARALARAEADALARRAELAELEKREEEVKKLRLAVRSAEMSLQVARKDIEERTRLVRAADEAAGKRVLLEQAAADRQPALKEAATESDATTWTLAAAEEQARETERVFQLRSKDLDYHHAMLDCQQLVERRGRVQDAQARADAAQALLDEATITDGLLERIEAAHVAWVGAQARLEAASPRVTVEPACDLEADVDGATRTLAAGDPFEASVPESLEIRIEGVLAVTVEAGTSTARLVEDRDLARTAFDALLREAGAPTVEAAREANAARARATDTLAQAKAAIAQDLRDLTLDEMDAKIGRLRNWETYPFAERPPEPTIAAGYEEACAARKDAKKACERAAHELTDARARAESVRDRLRTLREQAREVDIKLKLAVDAENHAWAEVTAARRGRRDAALERALERAEANALSARERHDEERRALEAAHPDRVRAGARAAAEAATEAARRQRAHEDEARDVRARLELQGEKGCFSALELARTHLERMEHERDAADRRAAAAKLLFETMAEAREAARRAYAAPLRDKIVELGRVVFGDTFDVELDQDLRIARRTLDGRTLDFADLSVGAREQLALIGRLACALLVDRTEGVPLILDDTLGHADPERLAGMGAMLGRAGDRCQIVVMTCTPGRFRHVENATVVRL